ncbi:hypothetical protein HRbin22_00416 [Candidatus Thermoflexus japonica]|uniref:DUF763 domain-containing protein n=1 Tax=Candidatus Thermoflexus japonica TaxID=2035417 RepID=A0A2H5Y409_9CHLR|nr:hypothetical protein HRbin22_00416 [Candidatus Thermoflexus japonica]
MPRTGFADLPLHTGRAPRWLFVRMTALAREIVTVLVDEFGTAEVLRRLSDPYWFQAFGCILGYDWHSSGVTTVVCGALKEALKDVGRDLGLFVAGGKGKASRRTPEEIEAASRYLQADPAALVYASRMAAKVDNHALQDGYQIYHHTMVFDREGRWAVIQQGMNLNNRYARRYHWFSETLTDFVREPHAAVCCDERTRPLNMVAAEAEAARQAVAELSREKPWRLLQELKRLQRLRLPPHHEILLQDIHPDHLASIFVKTYEAQPSSFLELLGLPQVGAKTVRALALLAELLYGTPLSFRDPARFAFAHGGKDRHPFPVDRALYDRSIRILHEAVERARLGDRERLEALRRLAEWQRRLSGLAGDAPAAHPPSTCLE